MTNKSFAWLITVLKLQLAGSPALLAPSVPVIVVALLHRLTFLMSPCFRLRALGSVSGQLWQAQAGDPAWGLTALFPVASRRRPWHLGHPVPLGYSAALALGLPRRKRRRTERGFHEQKDENPVNYPNGQRRVLSAPARRVPRLKAALIGGTVVV